MDNFHYPSKGTSYLFLLGCNGFRARAATPIATTGRLHDRGIALAAVH
jgi:hypothetical protein